MTLRHELETFNPMMSFVGVVNSLIFFKDSFLNSSLSILNLDILCPIFFSSSFQSISPNKLLHFHIPNFLMEYNPYYGDMK